MEDTWGIQCHRPVSFKITYFWVVTTRNFREICKLQKSFWIQTPSGFFGPLPPLFKSFGGARHPVLPPWKHPLGKILFLLCGNLPNSHISTICSTNGEYDNVGVNLEAFLMEVCSKKSFRPPLHCVVSHGICTWGKQPERKPCCRESCAFPWARSSGLIDTFPFHVVLHQGLLCTLSSIAFFRKDFGYGRPGSPAFRDET